LEIIESKKEFDSFLYKYNDYNWSPVIYYVFSDIHLHPSQNRISFLCIRIDEDYILPFNHNDAINLPIEYLNQLKTEYKKFVWNKKNLLHQIDFGNMVDISTLLYLKTNKDYNGINDENNYMSFWDHRLYAQKNLNDYTPLLKHYQYIQKFMDNNEIDDNFYNEKYDRVPSLLYEIERTGLYKTDKLVYTQYNPMTSTGRPSNRFGGVNYAALNKNDGSRIPYNSRFGDNGKLVEFDYDAYHLRLIGDVLDYDLPITSVHEYFANKYQVTYDEAKVLSFRYLYGGVPFDVGKNIEFFGKVKGFVKKLWKFYKSNKYIETYIYKKKILSKNMGEMNRDKLFNYFIQNLETERNMEVLNNLIPEIENYKSKLVLYNYDSFLIDFNVDDGLEYLNKIKRILEKDKFPVKINCGNTYNDMEDITEKFII
jgi:hypothetical protein